MATGSAAERAPRRLLEYIRADRVAILHRLRLASGLVLVAFVASHLANHAVGLAGLAAAEAVQTVFLLIWRSLPGTVLLGGAFLGHLALAFWAIYRRRTLAMPWWEAAQILVGLAIPLLLVGHFAATRLAAGHGVEAHYAYVLHGLLADPLRPAVQILLLLVAWTHGCIGLHYWLRLRPAYVARFALWRALAMALPLLALAGFWRLAGEVSALAADPAWTTAMLAAAQAPDAAARAALYGWRNDLALGFVLILAATLAARQLRIEIGRRVGLVPVSYSGRVVMLIPGQSVLEASRAAGITHVSVCGGRARCGACRIEVGRGADRLPQPSPQERRVLDRLAVAGNVRLGCQIRPTAAIEVRPILRRPPPLEGSFGDYRHAMLEED